MKPELHSRTSFVGGCALAALLLLTGCGGSEPPPAETETETSAPEPAPAATTDVCALVTAEEIQEVLGEAPGAPEASSAGLGGCRWPSASSSATLLEMSVAPTSLKSYDDFVADYGREFGGENPSKEYYRPHEGVGDWALYRKDDGVLQVYVGDRMLQIVAPEEKSVAIAAMALSRFP
jgi:hypothetical protein